MSCILVDENNINIDDRNKSLFQELCSKGNVMELCKIKAVNSEAWSMDFVRIDDLGRKVYRIDANTIEPNYAQFTHELLHIWLDDCGAKNIVELEILLNDVKVGLINNVFGSDYKSKGLKNDHFVVFENLISHFKMIDKFIELGFDRKEFLFSYENAYDCALIKLQKITNQYSAPNYEYILLYLRIRSLEYIHNEYSPKQTTMLVDELKNSKNKKVHKLIDFCDAFFEKWMSGDIGCDNHQLYKFMLDNYDNYMIAKPNDINDEINLF